MASEIERKFLVQGNAWRGLSRGVPYRQGYLSIVPERTVRIRTVEGRGYLTIKGMSRGPTRAEFEYEIPFSEATAMLEKFCLRPLIEKLRYRIEYRGLIWQVDEFLKENQGLILAELELYAADQAFECPPWIGREVTQDPRYFNANLIDWPYTRW